MKKENNKNIESREGHGVRVDMGVRHRKMHQRGFSYASTPYGRGALRFAKPRNESKQKCMLQFKKKKKGLRVAGSNLQQVLNDWVVNAKRRHRIVVHFFHPLAVPSCRLLAAAAAAAGAKVAIASSGSIFLSS